MRLRDSAKIAAAAWIAASSTGCEPSSLTEARDQLGRGGARVVEYVLPVIVDSVKAEDLLDSTAVLDTINGLLALEIDSKTVTLAIGALLFFGDSADVIGAQQVFRSELDFGDLEDAMLQSTINDGRTSLSVSNTAGTEAVLVDFNIGVVQLVGGLVPLDAFGDPVWEVDSLGNPILVPIVDPGQSTFTVPASGSTSATFPSGPLLDRLVKILIRGDDAALVGAGTVTAGGGGTGQILATDRVDVLADLTVLFDLTLPDTGVQVTRNSVNDGLALENQREVDSIIARIVPQAEFVAVVTNTTPFGAEIDLTFISGDQGDTDVFTLPGRVDIGRRVLTRPAVDALGRVSQASVDTIVVGLDPSDIRQLLDPSYTATARLRLLAGTGANNRTALQATDDVFVHARVRFQVQAGKAQ